MLQKAKDPEKGRWREVLCAALGKYRGYGSVTKCVGFGVSQSVTLLIHTVRTTRCTSGLSQGHQHSAWHIWWGQQHLVDVGKVTFSHGENSSTPGDSRCTFRTRVKPKLLPAELQAPRWAPTHLGPCCASGGYTACNPCNSSAPWAVHVADWGHPCPVYSLHSLAGWKEGGLSGRWMQTPLSLPPNQGTDGRQVGSSRCYGMVTFASAGARVWNRTTFCL